jgi:hypothetical protein
MDHRRSVAAKLLAAGITLSDDDLDQRAAASATWLTGQIVGQGRVKAATEPALVFRAKVEASRCRAAAHHSPTCLARRSRPA